MSEMQVGSIAASAPRLERPEESEHSVAGAFGEMLEGMLSQANRAQNEAERTAVELVRGEADMVDAMLATNEADLTLRMALEVRNRLLQAYQEVMRTI